jgi:hypothetical protein
MKSWYDHVLNRLICKYLISPEEFTEQIDEVFEKNSNCISNSGEKDNSSIYDSPRKVLDKYIEINSDETEMILALKDRLKEKGKNLPQNIVYNNSYGWVAFLEELKKDVYTRMKELVKRNPAPENIGCLMDLAFIEAYGFKKHGDLMSFLFTLPSCLWEAQFLSSLERRAFEKVLIRNSQIIYLLLYFAEKFSNRLRLLNILKLWKDNILKMINSGKVPKEFSSEEILVHAIFGGPWHLGDTLDKITKIISHLTGVKNTDPCEPLFDEEFVRYLLDKVDMFEEICRSKDSNDATPCPYCGNPLNPLAKQCFSCHMDWHDPNNVIKHKVGENKKADGKKEN